MCCQKQITKYKIGEKSNKENVDLLVKDVRYPTLLELDGFDTSNSDPDYSVVYAFVVPNSEFWSKLMGLIESIKPMLMSTLYNCIEFCIIKITTP